MARQAEIISAQVTISAKTQARLIENLIAISELEGSTFTFKELSDFLKSVGASLSRTTWFALRDPETRVTRFELLNGVAHFFGVPHEYLRLEDAPMPEKHEQIQGEVRHLRAEEAVDGFLKSLRSMDEVGLSYALELLDARCADLFPAAE